jgi:flavin reductase (DIM6/NTAB) family NADH-FMN oxidoreductase RutF
VTIGTEDDIASLFRLAMRRFPAAVTVITSSDGGVDVGMTATAVTSLSVQPPSLLVCINRTSEFHKRIEGSGGFCVNILRVDHQEISAAFGGAKPAGERFATGNWLHREGIPYLADAQASIFCRKSVLFAHTTHSIVIGEATALLMQKDVVPLIYVDGRYAALAPKLGQRRMRRNE